MALPTPDQVSELIRTRRSVFIPQFETGRAIPDEVVERLLESANWAPTHKRSEPWRFVVFAGAGLQKLADFQAELYKQTAGPKFNEGKYEKLLEQPVQCSHIIAIGMHPDPSLPDLEEIAATACAVQNLALLAHAYGLGGYWSTGGITFRPEAKPFFGLGSEDKLLGFFYLGYVRTPSPDGRRGPVQAKTTWVRA